MRKCNHTLHLCTRTHTHKHKHTHTHTHTQTLLLSLSTVIVSPHARCVSTQELTAWGAGYKAWEWLHKSYLESCLHMLGTCRTTHSSTVVYSYIKTHTHIWTRSSVSQAQPAVSKFQTYLKNPHNCYVHLTFLYFTDQHTQSKRFYC